jgi:RimJ/RimL family protein N-acetyltransferase
VERKDCDENNTGELGYMILTPWWSKGIGTEAVRQMCGIAIKELGIDCIEASVFEGNRASERVLEKNGFRLEETKAGTVVKDGKSMVVRRFVLV